MRLAKFTAALLSGILLTGCYAVNDSSADAVREKGALRIAVQESEQLYKLSEFITESLGVKPEYIQTDQFTALQMLSDGSADAAVGYYVRKDNPGLDYSMTIPFYSENVYAICPSDKYYTALSDLSGKLLGADSDLFDSVERQIMFKSANNTLYCSVPDTAVEMLKNNELDSFLCLEGDALKLISENDGINCCIMPDIEPEEYCVVLRKSDSQLYGAVNGAIGKYLTEETK